jgi:hypothetical protein
MYQDTHTLDERLERLERENSRMKRSARLMKIMMASAIALCAVFSVPRVESKQVTGVPVLSAQEIDLVNAGGTVLASLAPTSDGNVLTFFDSSGKKTLTLGDNTNQSFAGLVTWDNNKVIPGTGVVRTTFGESNPNVGPSSGFGGTVLDGTGHLRTGFGTTYDLVSNDIFAVDSDGSSTGIGAFQATKFKGFFTNDSNGVTRQFGGLSFDSAISDNLNEIALTDPTGVVRVSAAQVPPDFVNPQNGRGNAFVIWDSHGLQQASMGAFVDGSVAGFETVDPNNVIRLAEFLTTQNGMNIDTFDANGNLTGHLP